MVNSIEQEGRIKKFFHIMQEQMFVSLKETSLIQHPSMQGDSSEAKWLHWLETYLPKRYCVDKAIVIDSKEQTSDQIDIVIYDRQYTPFIFNDETTKYVPAESVYAVFEVKPILNKEHIEYAANKAFSVRKLHRTSAPIYNILGCSEPVKPKEIIAGILTREVTWRDDLGESFFNVMKNLNDIHRLNIGCCISTGSFYFDKTNNNIEISDKEEILIYFFLKLLNELQKVGTVPAININEYGKFLTKF